MVCMRVLGVVALLTLAAAPTTSAQEPFEQCGDIQLIFRNPDLQRENDGNIHAQGSFFAQFQAIGPNADDITFFGFSFGPVQTPIEDSSGVCDMPAGTWLTGAYILNYRADTNPDDGFFINLQTPLVPDGTYTAAVHAYDANNQELARAWTNAVVDNCDGAPPARCDGATSEHVNQDKTAPWPILLPGDGDLDAAPDTPSGATLTIEFAEPLSEVKLFINGKEETGNLTAWDGREWDDDLLPGYGPLGLGGLVFPECSQQPPQECTTLGEAYYWDQREITDDDLVRVEAIDEAGNVAIKELHIGSGVGGAITDDLPNLQVSVDEPTQLKAPGETAIYKFTLNNVGGTTAHPFATAEGPEGWTLRWFPEHVPTDPGSKNTQELNVDVPADALSGTYQVNATINYDRGGQTEERTFPLTINVATGGTGAGAGPAAEEEGAPVDEESPGFGLVALLAALGAVLVLRRRPA